MEQCANETVMSSVAILAKTIWVMGSFHWRDISLTSCSDMDNVVLFTLFPHHDVALVP